MSRIRQSDGASKGYPRVPANDYGTKAEGNAVGSPVLNEAQLIRNRFKLTATVAVISITTHPTSRSVKEGVSTTFTVVASGAPTITYQWKKNGINVGTNSASYTYTPVLGDSGALVTVTATNASGSATSNAATLTVTPAVIGLDWRQVNATGRTLARILGLPSGSFAKFLAIDAGGDFFSSDNLTTWTNRGLGNSTAASAFANIASPWRAGNGKVLMFSGNNNYPVYSFNLSNGSFGGVAAPQQADAYSASIVGADYGNGMWMAIMANTINRSTANTDKSFFTSTDNGATWTRLAHNIEPTFWSAKDLLFVNGAWYAAFGSKKMKSIDDGANWTQVSTNTSFGSLQYNAARGKFYAINTDIGGIDESTDFTTWTNRPTPTAFTRLTVTDTVMVAHRTSVFDNRIYYSTDGITWQTVTLTTATSNSMGAIASGDGKLVYTTYGAPLGVSP